MASIPMLRTIIRRVLFAEAHVRKAGITRFITATMSASRPQHIPDARANIKNPTIRCAATSKILIGICGKTSMSRGVITMASRNGQAESKKGDT
jgi:hypothetical protein